MRTPNGLDRLSTEEELSQVLSVLQDLVYSGWVVPGEDSVNTIVSDSLEADCLTEMMQRKPPLKN
jgi:hypothetical protein